MGPQGLLVLGLRHLSHTPPVSVPPQPLESSTPVPVSAPPTSLDECLFSISLVLVPLAVQFSVSSGCARRRSASTYAAILVLLPHPIFKCFPPPVHPEQEVHSSLVASSPGLKTQVLLQLGIKETVVRLHRGYCSAIKRNELPTHVDGCPERFAEWKMQK